MRMHESQIHPKRSNEMENEANRPWETDSGWWMQGNDQKNCSEIMHMWDYDVAFSPDLLKARKRLSQPKEPYDGNKTGVCPLEQVRFHPSWSRQETSAHKKRLNDYGSTRDHDAKLLRYVLAVPHMQVLSLTASRYLWTSIRTWFHALLTRYVQRKGSHSYPPPPRASINHGIMA